MRKTTSLMLLCLLFAILAGCNNKKNENNNNAPKLVAQQAETDSTIYGKCGDGSTMNVLQLITDKGDTLEFSLMGEDTTTIVQGGMLAGDNMAVIAHKATDGSDMLFAEQAINLTSLLGTWQSIDRTFSIEEGGTVSGDNQEPKPYVDWRICNGKLILTADTFSIYNLGPDSLLIENTNGIYAYKRVRKQ